MASPKNRDKRMNPDLLNHKYDGKSYKKPRRMKPRNMTDEAIESFNSGHDKRPKKGGKR